jgi:hypothetical protein
MWLHMIHIGAVDLLMMITGVNVRIAKPLYIGHASQRLRQYLVPVWCRLVFSLGKLWCVYSL